MHSSSPDACSDPLRVGLLGLGVVGSGVQRLLQRNAALIVPAPAPSRAPARSSSVTRWRS